MAVINDTSLRLMLAIQIPSDLPFFPVTMNIGKKKKKKKQTNYGKIQRRKTML